MIHDRQRLPFQVKAQQSGIVVAPRFDDFQRNLALDGRRLFGHPHLPHPSFTEFPNQPIGSNRAQIGCRYAHRSIGGVKRGFGIEAGA
jgi:hypothetical protein